MATVELIRYGFGLHSVADDFEDLLRSLELTYSTRHLAAAGLTASEIGMAITAAIRVCRLNQIDPTNHFRSRYIFDERKHDLYTEWRMTRQGFALAIMHAPNITPAIARWQWELVNGVE
jgi:hypothetical protein